MKYAENGVSLSTVTQIKTEPNFLGEFVCEMLRQLFQEIKKNDIVDEESKQL